MKTKKFGLMWAMFVASALLAGPSRAEDLQAQMAKMKELGTPGAEHAVLNNFIGKWKVTSHSWMKPGDAPQESKATSTFKWVLDGHFLQQKYKGDWAGEPFEGIGFLGYDKMKKKYVSVWMDSMATSFFESAGQYHAATRTIKDSGTFACPLTNETNKWFRAEWKIIDKKQHIYSMYFKDAKGKEFKSMELVYRR